MFEEVFAFIESSKKNREIYSPYRFLTGINDVNAQNKFFYSRLKQLLTKENIIVYKAEVQGLNHFFIVSPLSWDSEYFGFQNFRVDFIIYDHNMLAVLNQAVNQFFTFSCKFPRSYFFIDVPAEDYLLVQSLGNTPFKLIETRLNYILRNLTLSDNNNYPVRLAVEEDIPYLRRVAKDSANPFDRVHADSSFSKKQSDDYIGTFIENAVRGFADIVLVPDLPGTGPFAFLAFNNPVEIDKYKVAKLVLAGSDKTVEKGWLYKLLVEAIRILQKKGTTHLTTITQGSNLPAIKSWEKTGFDFGFCTHIFSFKTP
jgi:dTDP-4-amino-4,6-dideoxy-D-galactose acyltransferase